MFIELSDQALLEAYEAAIEKKLDSDFIQLLLEAIQKRNLSVEIVSVS